VTPRHRSALLAAAALFAVTSALYACGTAPAAPPTAAAQAGVAVPAAATRSAETGGSPTPAATAVKLFGRDAKPLARLPKDNPRTGQIYRGLTVAKTGPCVGGYQIGNAEKASCTHGPDAPPQDVSVKAAATPVTAAAAAVAANGLPVCEGDGSTGRRVEVLYVHGATSQYDKYLDTFRVRAEQVDDIYYQSALETGGVRHVRYVTETVDGVCRPVVRDVTIADSELRDFDKARTAVVNLGYSRADRKYLMFVDINEYCGIGEFLGDTTKSDANLSNGIGYSRVDNGCWQYPDVAAHELGHNLGAVNYDAPNTSHQGHCVDEYDVMCYQDDKETVLRIECAAEAHDLRLDCNHDDYYNTNPSAGSYLAKEFNVADNLFLIKGTGTSPSPSTSPSTSSSPTSSPIATIRLAGGESGRCVDLNADVVDNGAQAQLWDCHSGRNQAWTYTSLNALLLHDNKCLDALGKGTSDGTKVVVWDCNGQTNQQWTFTANGTLTSVPSGLCLDASAGRTNGAKLQLRTCTGNTNQQWTRR